MLTTTKISRSRAAGLTLLRGYDRSVEKIATLGGEGRDTDFEIAFSNVAHSFLRDRAPTLQQYEVGFQLLDRNQDNTKACGIFGFKVGSQWLYAPVFFLNGDLKGHELLYIKNEDQFVPLKENWLNSILRKKPNVLGEPVDRSPWRHGITAPDLQSFSRSPGKFASAVSPGMLPGVAAFSYFAVNDPYTDSKYKSQLDLSSFLKKEGSAVIKKLCQTLLEFPKLAVSFRDMYGDLGVIRQALEATRTEEGLGGVLGKSAAESCSAGMAPNPAAKSKKTKPGMGVLPEPEKKTDAVKMGLSIFTSLSSQSSIDLLSAADKESLLREGVLVFDKRAEEAVSVAYSVQEPLALTNPTHTGIYDVLVRPGSFERCLVAMGPHSHNQREDFSTLVRLDGERTYLNAHPTLIWVKQKGTTDNNDYNSMIGSLPAADSLPAEDSDDYYMLLGPGGQTTCVFRVINALNTSGDIKTYDVRFRDYARHDRPANLPSLGEKGREYDHNWDYGERITLTGKSGGTLTILGGDVFVPAGFKLLKVKSGKKGGGDGECCSMGDGFGSSFPPPIVPGNQIDLRQAIFSKTAALKVSHLGSEVQINGRSMSPTAGLVHLISQYGLREKAARVILQETAQSQIGRYRVKCADGYYPYAQGYDLQQSGPNAPSFPEPMQWTEPTATAGANAFGPQEQSIPVGMPPTNREIYDPRIMPDQNAIQSATQAAAGGQREIFDTSIIGSLLKSMRDDTMVDRHLPDLMKALDRLGRILFSFYWHGEEFMERFGKQDMPNLEDGLRNSFENLGDLIHDLKEKTVEPFPEMPRSNLEDVARD